MTSIHTEAVRAQRDLNLRQAPPMVAGRELGFLGTFPIRRGLHVVEVARAA